MSCAAGHTAALPALNKAALLCGYSLGVRGLVDEDMELIAAPWTNEAGDEEKLVKAMAEAIGLDDLRITGPFERALGRNIFVISISPSIRIYVNVAPAHPVLKIDLNIPGKPAVAD